MNFYFESKEGKMKHMSFYYSVIKVSGDTSSSRWWKEGEIKHNHLYFAKRMRRGKTEVVALLHHVGCHLPTSGLQSFGKKPLLYGKRCWCKYASQSSAPVTKSIFVLKFGRDLSYGMNPANFRSITRTILFCFHQ